MLTEGVLWLNPNLRAERAAGAMPVGYEEMKISVPGGEVGHGVNPRTYEEYRRGLDGACADIVVTTLTAEGVPAVIATFRAKNKCFGGKWWMQGGATHAYRPLTEFLVERAMRECGVAPVIQGIIGFFRTCAEDSFASTLEPCYVGWVPPEELTALSTDSYHWGIRLLTLADLDALPEEEKHWYPMLVFRQALQTMP